MPQTETANYPSISMPSEQPKPKQSRPTIGQTTIPSLNSVWPDLKQLLGLKTPEQELQDQLAKGEGVSRLHRLGGVASLLNLYDEEERQFKDSYDAHQALLEMDSGSGGPGDGSGSNQESEDEMGKTMVGGDNVENVTININVPESKDSGGDAADEEEEEEPDPPAGKKPVIPAILIPDPAPITEQPATLKPTVARVLGPLLLAAAIPTAAIGAATYYLSRPGPDDTDRNTQIDHDFQGGIPAEEMLKQSGN